MSLAAGLLRAVRGAVAGAIVGGGLAATCAALSTRKDEIIIDGVKLGEIAEWLDIEESELRTVLDFARERGREGDAGMLLKAAKDAMVAWSVRDAPSLMMETERVLLVTESFLGEEKDHLSADHRRALRLVEFSIKSRYATVGRW